jgi:hypothetical protein
MFDCIRDNDGQISKTINEIFSNWTNEYDEVKLFSAVNDFCSLLVRHNIQFFDLNLCNVVVNVLSDNSYKLFAVDIKA